MTDDEMVGWHHRLDGHGFGLLSITMQRSPRTLLSYKNYLVINIQDHNRTLNIHQP